MTSGKVEKVDCPWDSPEEKTNLRGWLFSGRAEQVRQVAGEEAVRNVIVKAIAPFKTPSDGYFAPFFCLDEALGVASNGPFRTWRGCLDDVVRSEFELEV